MVVRKGRFLHRGQSEWSVLWYLYTRKNRNILVWFCWYILQYHQRSSNDATKTIKWFCYKLVKWIECSWFFFVLFCEFTHKYDLFLCILVFLTSHVLTRSKFYCYLIIFHYQMLFSTCSEVISIILFFICLFASRLIVFFFSFQLFK